MNLSKLMFAGSSGSSLVGAPPNQVIGALTRRFEGVGVHFAPGVFDQEIRCYDSTGLRMIVQYRHIPRLGGWQYQPVSVKRRVKNG